MLNLYVTKYRPNILGKERGGRCSNNVFNIIASLNTLFRLVLAEYEYEQYEIQRSDYGAVGERCDIRFHPENCRKELEVSFIIFLLKI